MAILPMVLVSALEGSVFPSTTLECGGTINSSGTGNFPCDKGNDGNFSSSTETNYDDWTTGYWNVSFDLGNISASDISSLNISWMYWVRNEAWNFDVLCKSTNGSYSLINSYVLSAEGTQTRTLNLPSYCLINGTTDSVQVLFKSTDVGWYTHLYETWINFTYTSPSPSPSPTATQSDVIAGTLTSAGTGLAVFISAITNPLVFIALNIAIIGVLVGLVYFFSVWIKGVIKFK